MTRRLIDWCIGALLWVVYLPLILLGLIVSPRAVLRALFHRD